MNRTDRQFALVEELQAAAPQPRAARWLADRLNVSIRTIERDLAALQRSGLPVYGDRGRRGGYVLDKERTLPLLNMTPDEAVAISVALRELRGAPFEAAARTVLDKLTSMMAEQDVVTAEKLVDRVRPVTAAGPRSAVPKQVQRALDTGRVLRLHYRDRYEHETWRTVEPMGLLHGPRGWYLLAWCRLRDAPRGFLLDRVSGLEVGEEVKVDRRVDRDPSGAGAPALRKAG
ncbi:putative DNA-binding transcriptional regulator YafY [Kibdelosporangium banguiense]|uniref:DNA-binding transcriptional regulator YafY n=1 Tax=Kibdelosporangium banguiense TaxID=1365924 RepID=A0ABS4TZU1_9PSEU|nr:WYL domain-containing protein [Kibdelosporangium banguiense]MBP2329922.1 putative DNA-binding transcriptional regulator YafY [Kibdelosporangium banguiense]